MTADETSPRDTLLRMTNAFQVSQAIHVAAALGIADLLEDGPKSADELAEATGTHAPSLYRLLRALASVGIFVETDGRFASTPLAECLRTDTPGSLRAWAMLIGQRYGWTSWGHLLYSVRTGEPAFPDLYGTTAWEYRAVRPEEDAVFNAAMTALSSGVVEAVVQSYAFSGIGTLVDVGGGEGAAGGYPGGESVPAGHPLRSTPRRTLRRSPSGAGRCGGSLRGSRRKLLRSGARRGGCLPAKERHPRLGR